MKTPVLILSLALTCLSVSAQTLFQPYQIKVGTNDFLVMATPGTNLQATLKWMSDNWHSKQGYGTTNQIEDLRASMTNADNALILSNSNLAVLVTNSVNGITNSVLVSNAFYAVTAAPLACPASGATKLLFATEIFDLSGEFASSTFTPTITGEWLLTVKCDADRADPTTGTGRNILKLYSNGSELTTLHRHNEYQGGTEEVISYAGIYVCSNAIPYEFYLTRDGGAALTNTASSSASATLLRRLP